MRVSVTDRCNLHCAYCRPRNGEEKGSEGLLTLDELFRICEAAAGLGISVFKITGGEPLLREGCIDFMARLRKLPGVEHVTLTTNGTLLKRHIPEISAAGVDYVNLSVDTLDAGHYHALTGGNLRSVLECIDECLAYGLRLKLNCVPLRAFAPAEYVELARMTRHNIPVRFIELMPLECNAGLSGYAAEEMLAILRDGGYKLHPVDGSYGFGPAKYYSMEGYPAPIGFIEPLHGRFCSSCNRVRLTAEGQFKTCLYSNDLTDLRSLVRDGAKASTLQQAMTEAVSRKAAGHDFCAKAAAFAMSNIGG